MKNNSWHPILVTLTVNTKYWLYYNNSNSMPHLYELKKMTERGYCFVNPITGKKYKNNYFYPSTATAHILKEGRFVFFMSRRIKITEFGGKRIL